MIGGDVGEFPRSRTLCYSRRCQGPRSTLWAMDVCVSLLLYHEFHASHLFHILALIPTSTCTPSSPVRSILAVFTKCKEFLQDGRRLEDISWRLWHRELVQAQIKAHSLSSSSIFVVCPSYQLLTPVSMTPSHPDDSGRSSPAPAELPAAFTADVVFLSHPQLKTTRSGEHSILFRSRRALSV